MLGFEAIFPGKEIVGTFNTAKKLLECIGLLESIDSKLNKLIQCELNSGFDALNMAARASCKESQNKFLWDALEHFRKSRPKAKSLEKNERLCIAHIGVVICLYYLGERQNTINKLREFAQTKFTFDGWEKFGNIIKTSVFSSLNKNFVYDPTLMLTNPLESIEYQIKKIKLAMNPNSMIVKYFDKILNFRLHLKNVKETDTINELSMEIEYVLLIEKNLKDEIKKYKEDDPDCLILHRMLYYATKELDLLLLRKQAFEYADKLERKLL
ncbi:MAG: hypothetical protein RLZZ532_3674 [Cyanobacteriota bacterium]